MPPKRRVGQKAKQIEPMMLTIMSNRLGAITQEASNTLLRTARSGIVATAKDFSVAITDALPRLVMATEGIPVQLGTMQLLSKAVLDLFGDDIKPGDRFINNSPYHGNLHHGDVNITAPVFYKDELLFFITTRTHQSDTGVPVPSAFNVFTKDVYQEGLYLPCVRVQRDYKDIPDIIRICRMKIRNADVWYGDYLGQTGSVNVGETRLVEFVEKYGIGVVKAFLDEWQDYGRRRMIYEISRLPKGTWQGEVKHDAIDPVKDLFPQGIPVRAKLSINPQEGYVTIDVRDNIDNLPCGLNLAEASVRVACLIGVMNVLPQPLPVNEGASERIKIKMREGCMIGRPKFPASTTLASNNMVHMLVNLVQSLFAEITTDRGMAQGATGVRVPSISGVDWRHNNKPLADTVMFPGTGGPAVYGHDGWLTYFTPSAGGCIMDQGVEISELKYPLIFEREEIIPDSGGAGKWSGGPGAEVILGPRHDTFTWTIAAGGHDFPPEGVRGGEPGRQFNVYMYKLGKEEWAPLPSSWIGALRPDERFVVQNNGGGGFGDPLERDPEMVRKDVLKGYVTLEKAQKTYGVILDTGPEQYAVRYPETAKLREELRKGRNK